MGPVSYTHLDVYKRQGQNGAGKTTFIKLLCRFYDVSEGSITLNGIDIRKYDYQEYMNLFAAVFQDFALFAFAVGENIACSQDPDQDRVWKALRCAGAEEKVKRMSKQLDTPLYFEEEGGESISGGEAQKLAIARALYKDCLLYTSYRDEVMNRLARFVEYAKEQDVVLLHENEKGIYGDVASRCREIFEKLYCENFRCTFDLSLIHIYSSIYITIGTGVGVGVMLEGRLLHGMLHCEGGHVILKRYRCV